MKRGRLACTTDAWGELAALAQKGVGHVWLTSAGLGGVAQKNWLACKLLFALDRPPLPRTRVLPL